MKRSTGNGIWQKLHIFVSRNSNLILRIILCWLLGISFLIFDESQNFDLRFELRGPQPINENIVLIDLTYADWQNLHQQMGLRLPIQRDYYSISDQLFWNHNIWAEALEKLLKSDVETIGVSFNFIDLPREQLTQNELQSFNDPRVVWSSTLENGIDPVIPYIVDTTKQRLAFSQLELDKDEMVRNISLVKHEIPHMSEVLSSFITDDYYLPSSHNQWKSRLINYRGEAGLFPTIKFVDLVQGKTDLSFLKDKIVIIGSSDSERHIYRTPLGRMSRAEIIANITDNILENRWITRPAFYVYALSYLILVIFLTFIVFYYTQTVSLVIFSWITVLFAVMSLWAFDQLYLWVPIFSVALLHIVTYVIFLSFQLSLRENQNWRLEQEKRYLFEIEQLKNNFVSLISHDLKTPISKIQAIVERLLISESSEPVIKDLNALKAESVELHRYIQSILKLSRLEAKDMRLNKEATDVNELIENSVKQLSPIAKEKNIRIHLKLEPMFLIEVDSILIYEVILNIVENAIKYTPENGEVTVTSNEVDDWVYIIVEDTGVGISDEEQNKIFEKFHRGKQHSLSTKGTGLGLYLVKFFVELHGGDVNLTSQVGKGTKVTISLPVDATNT